MQTRREQVQAHRFVTRRIVSAMLSGEPETNDLPMRRLGQAIFASIMIGTLVVAAFGVIGLLTGNGSALEPNTLIVEEETGATFVYLNDTGANVLYPVTNYASARLILGEAQVNQRRMSHEALQDLDRGPRLGIPDAPDALPTVDSLVGLPWTVCDVPVASGGGTKTVSRVLVGQGVPGGATVTGDDSLLISYAGEQYLVYNHQRMHITEPTAATALGFDAPPIRATAQFVNAIPPGPNLATLGVTGAGQDANMRVGTERSGIGWVYIDENNQYYLQTRDALVRIGAALARMRLVRDNRASNLPLPPHQISANEASRHLAVNQVYEPTGYPYDVPQLLNEPSGGPVAICSQYDEADGAGQATISIYRSVPASLAKGVDVAQNPTDIVSATNQVIIAGGHGAIVQPTPGPRATARGSTLYLVTDDGVKYPLAPENQTAKRKDALTALGYANVPAVHVPLSILDLMPTGVTLDAKAARKPVVTEPGPSPSPQPSTSPSSSPPPSSPPPASGPRQ